MNPFQQLIRKKLAAKLAEEKQRIAESLLTEMPVTPAMKKQKKQQQIAALQAKIGLLKSKIVQSKNPAQAKETLDTMNAKLKLYQDEMSQIH